MSRVTAPGLKRPKPREKPQRQPEPKPLLPQHQLPEPYSRLLAIGEEDAPAVYEAVSDEIRRADVKAGVHTLLQMALDESWYDYNFEEFPKFDDPRSWTRLHAVRALERLGEEAAPAIEPLMPLLDEDDDWLREEMPFFYAAVGRAAIEPLTARLLDQQGDTFARAGASESLAELAEKHADLRPEIVPILEQAIVNEAEDETVTAYVICSLLDLGSRESLPLIEQAYLEDRVDLSVVDLPDVQEHLGLPVTAPRRSLQAWRADADAEIEPEDEEWTEVSTSIEPVGASSFDEPPPQQPYVAAPKPGRNEPCPCGSGKKYKKCCGAA